MNPHFIHNILTIISMEAQEFDQIKIMNICSRLSRMLHYSSSMGDGFSTVAEELKHTSNYLSLMKERYEELFQYTIEIDESIQGVHIPKLIIQPVCENSFNHAFKVIEPDWKLNIKAYSKDKQWFVEIKDNGKGFNEEFLNKVELMRKNVSMENAKAALEKLEIGGLSILNIYMRLRLIYGEGMVFILRNDADGATVVLGGEIENVKSIDRRG
ncbi:Sensor histidine kinase YpdA [compost metagenome]